MSSHYRISVAILLAVFGQALAVGGEDKSLLLPAPVASVRVVLPKDAAPVLQNIAALFARQVQQRCAAKVATTGEAPLQVELAVQPGIGTEGFTISDVKPGVICIAGNDLRGVLYGVGKFLHTSRYDQGGFTPGAGAGLRCPRRRCAAFTLLRTSTISTMRRRSKKCDNTSRSLACGASTRSGSGTTCVKPRALTIRVP